MQIPLPQPEVPDIYSIGFDKSLFRPLVLPQEIQSPLVYNALTDAVNASILTSGVGLESGKLFNISRQYAVNHESAASKANGSLQALRTFTLNGADLGLNGLLEIRSRWTLTNGASSKQIQVRIGSTSIANDNGENTASLDMVVTIRTQNSSQAQVISANWVRSDNTIRSAFTTTSLDFTKSWVVSIMVQKDVAGDIATLESYETILYPSITPV